MMAVVSKYLLQILSAAVIVGILSGMAGAMGGTGKLIRMMGGIFLALTVARPLVNLDWNELQGYVRQNELAAEAFVQQGRSYAQQEYRTIIKAETEAYILDKAKAYGAQLEVEVMLRDTDPPVPESVVLQGNISPFGKAALQRFIQEDLNIGEEAQVWIG